MLILFDWLEKLLRLNDPPLSSATDYAEIVSYLMDQLNISIKYYRIVFYIGFAGFVFSGILFYWLYRDYPDAIYDIKSYPAAIPSMVTMAFSHLEMERKKKELYTQLEKIAREHALWTDQEQVAGDYKKWAWSEFQDKFKPQNP